MREATLALAVAVISTVHSAKAAEFPVSEGAVGSTTVLMARWSPPGHADPAVPIPLSKPLARPRPPRRKPPARLAPEKACRIIESAAEAYRVPVDFLTRLIWSESRFHTGAVSPAGAQGIAQFMPAAAKERGLTDPFDPELSLWAAANLLSDLKQRFGNFGLAAAAYNAGPKRVSDWLRKQRRLPEETRNYVKAVTGRPAKSWAALPKRQAADIVAGAKADVSCAQMAAALEAADSARR